jgi:hypothetical protein
MTTIRQNEVSKSGQNVACPIVLTEFIQASQLLSTPNRQSEIVANETVCIISKLCGNFTIHS